MPFVLAWLALVGIGAFAQVVVAPAALRAQDATEADAEMSAPSAAPFAAPLPSGAQPFQMYLPLVTVSPWLDMPFPADAATRLSLNTYLTWSSKVPQASGARFDVYLEAMDTTPDVLIAKNLAKPALDPPTFELATTYYWQVVAKDNKGKTYVGPVWSFTTEALTDPPDVEAMVYVPQGEFLMGCDRNNPDEFCRADSLHREEPLHRVYLDAYWIDKYEVTNRQYRECVAAKACRPPRKMDSWTRDSYYDNLAFDYYPVLYVSWWDGQAYCGWKGKRLPTEAEWEKAARGPIDTRAWPWGTELPDCNRENTTLDFPESPLTICVGDTAPVGSHPTGASPYGAMDMSGNVFEWVQDLYTLYLLRGIALQEPTGSAVAKSVRERGPDLHHPGWQLSAALVLHAGGASSLGPSRRQHLLSQRAGRLPLCTPCPQVKRPILPHGHVGMQAGGRRVLV